MDDHVTPPEPTSPSPGDGAGPAAIITATLSGIGALYALTHSLPVTCIGAALLIALFSMRRSQRR